MRIGADTPAVITGGASGLGTAVTSALRAQDGPVGILDMNADAGQKFAAKTGATFAQCDISDAAAVSAAYEGRMGQWAYASSKAGDVGLTLPMACDLAKSGIRVVAIAPGIFATSMVTGFPQEFQDALARTSEFPQRLGRVEEFADLALHIAQNAMLKGEVICLDSATRMQSK